MNLLISGLIPASVKNRARNYRDHSELKKLATSSVMSLQMPSFGEQQLSDIFHSQEFEEKWKSVQAEMEKLGLPENTGGVNGGDQRAIAYLIWHFKPSQILEIGTHIGCSTVHLAAAQRDLPVENGKITTVDIRDVNDPDKKPWKDFKSPSSPAALIAEVRYQENVDFVVMPSVEYLASTKKTFDFIFLDGGHSASLVYQELPLASRLLNKNGLILLHDYFPGNRPIWDNNSIIPGPYLATQRLIKEGSDIKIIPLGALPWKTKRNSNHTSLAVCTKG